MTYLDLINRFWQKDLEYGFTSTEVDVYFRLLDRCNKLGWKSPFNLSVEKLMAQMGLRTKKPLDTARKHLREAGLLEFKNGNGRGFATEYALIGVELNKERGPERGNKNTPLLGSLSGTFSGIVSGPVHKSEKKKKDKEVANATSALELSENPTPSLKAKKELVPPVAKPPREKAAETGPGFDDFWQAYGKKLDLYKCQQRWRALTPAEQVAALAHVPRYVAATPEKRYRKNPLTYLNGRAWLDEDTPEPAGTTSGNGPAPAPARAATSPTKTKAQNWS